MDALQSPQDDPMYQAFHAAATGAPASSPPPPITDTGGEDPMYQAFHAAATRGRPAAPKPTTPADTGGLWAGIKNTAGETAKGFAQLGADYVPGVSQDNALKKWGQEVVDANPVPQGMQGWMDHPLDSALSFGGSMAASVGTAGGIAALGKGISAIGALPIPHPLVKGAATAVGRGLQVAAPYLAFGAPAQSSIREQQIHDDPSAATDLSKKLLATAGAGTVGAITHHMGPAGKLGEPLLTAAGRSALGARLTGSTLTGEFIKGAGMGAAQGLLATPVEQMAALHNPFSPDNLLQTAESAISGALGGGIIGGAMHTGHRALRGSVNDTNTPKDLLNPEPVAGLLGYDGSQGEQWRPTMYGYPEGAVGTAADLPNWTMANSLRLDTLRAKAEGTPTREVADDTGNITKVPGWKKQKLTKEEAAEYKDLMEREKRGAYQFDPVADEHSFVNQGVPLPVDVGSAIAALRQLSPAPILAGSDAHLAVLRADQLLRRAGIDPSTIGPAPVIQEGASVPGGKRSAARKAAAGTTATPETAAKTIGEQAIAEADIPAERRPKLYTKAGKLNKDAQSLADILTTGTPAELLDLHGKLSSAATKGQARADWALPALEHAMGLRGVKYEPFGSNKPASAVVAEPAAQGDQARGMMEHLLTKLQGTQRAGVGRDYAGMLRTYLGLDGTGDEKLQAVAEAHGLSTRSSAHQAIFGYTNRGKWVKGAVERVKDLAEAEGFTSKEAKEALEALRQSREDQYGLSEDQKEIQRATGALETGLDSENQGRMDYTDAAMHGLISQEMKHHNMGDAAAAMGAKYSEDGAESTSKGAPLSSDRMASASMEALVGDQALDLGADAKNQAGEEMRNTSRTKAVATFKSAAERKAAIGKTVAEIDAEQAAERAGKEQAKADAQALKAAQQRENTQAAKEKRQPQTLTMGDLNKKVVRGDTAAPKYNHTPEESAKGEMFWAEFAEDAAAVGDQGVAFAELPKGMQDAYIQAVKDVLNAPTVRPNFDKLQKLFQFYTDEYYDQTTRHTDTGAGRLPERSVPPSNESPPAAKPAVAESGGKAAPDAEADKAKGTVGDSVRDQEPTLEDIDRALKRQADVEQAWNLTAGEEGLPKFYTLSKEDQDALLRAHDEGAWDDGVDGIANRLVEEKGAAVEPPVEKAAAPEPAKATAAPTDIEPQVTRARQLLADLRGKKHDASHVQELLDLLSGSPEVAEAVRVAEGYKNLSALSDAIETAAKAAEPVAVHKPTVDEPQAPSTPTGETQPPAEKVVQRRRVVKMEKSEAPRAAVAEDVAQEAKSGTTDEATLRATLASIAGTDNHRNVTVFATAQDAIAAGALKSENAKGAQAWVHKGRAYFVAENIKKGQELAVFLHEVGVHLGMEKAVGPANYAKLTDQIATWLAKGTGVEGEIAKAAHARVLSAEGSIVGGIAKGRQKDELLAYFVEEAVKRGIDPTAKKYNSELGRWFATLWTAFKDAVKKLGFNPDKLSAQDVVDLAYGAARLELHGVWHGTAADFDQFNHAFVGSGEGNQSYGWGSYFGEHRGTGDQYRKDDVGRKTAASADNSVFAVRKENGERYTTNSEVVAALRAAKGDYERAQQTLTAGKKGSNALVAALEQAKKDGVFYGPRVVGEGTLMRVDHNVKDHEMLDLDKPLDQQSRHVMEALEVAQARVAKLLAGDKYALDDWNRGAFGLQTAGNWYNSILTRALGSQEAASKYLDSIGIKGAKYSDSGSRVTGMEGKETNNHVIYNDANIQRVSTRVAGNDSHIKFATTPKEWAIGGEKDTAKSHLTTVDVVAKEEGPQFSKAAPDLDAAKTPEQRKVADDFFTKQIDRMPPGPVKDATGKTYFGIKDAVRNGLLGSAFIHDVVDHLENLGVKAVRKYSDTMEAKNRLSHVLSALLQDLAGMANDLKAHELAKDGSLSVNKFMSDMSYAGKWAWQLPKDSPLWKGRQVQVDPALAKRFGALSPAAQEVAKQAVDFGETMRQELAKVGVDISAGDGPYLPHKRFGNWLVVSKSAEYAKREARKDGSHEELKDDPNHYHVSAFGSAWEAREFRNQQRANKAYAGEDLDNRVHLTKAEEYFSQIQLAPMQQIARLESMINSENGLSGKQKAAVVTSLQNLYKQTLSNVSARHAEQRRANVGGADADMLRALFTQGHASAALVASLAHGKEIEQSLTAMRDEAHNLDRDGSAKSALNEVLRRHALSMLYRPTPIQNKIMALTAFQKVITSPAFFLQQTVEPFMMLAPVLAGHFNDYRGTMKEMGSAYAQAMQTIGLNPMHSGSAPDAILAKLKGHKNSVGRDYDAIKELIETGRADLGNFNEFGNLGMRADKPVAHAVNTVLSKVSRVATDMEEINRIASGLTAYRMKYKQLVAGGKGADAAHTEATAYASRMVDHSHGNYSAWASPRYMMQAGSSLPIRLITQFRKFQVMELSLLGRLVHGAFHADTPESKAMAQRALAYMTGQMAVVAGGLGIPMAGVAADIASLFLRDDNEPWGRETTELHLRKMIGDPTLSNLLLHGAPAGAGVDVSKRIGGGGMGDLAPYSELDVGSRKGFEGTLPKLLGPFIGGTLPAGFDAYKLMRQGEYQRGMESLAPTLIANMSKAQRFAEHGVTNAKGDVLLKPGQLSSFDIAAQALGLPSTHLTDRQFKQSVLMGQEEKWKEMEERYVHQYVKASRDKDAAEKAAALASYKAIQDAKRHAGGIGTPLSEILKAPMEQMRRQVQNVGGVEVTKQTRGIMRQLEQQGV